MRTSVSGPEREILAALRLAKARGVRRSRFERSECLSHIGHAALDNLLRHSAAHVACAPIFFWVSGRFVATAFRAFHAARLGGAISYFKYPSVYLLGQNCPK